MITIIFLDDNKEPVSISFSHNPSFNKDYVYGIWNVDTNEVHLNDNGWSFLHEHRKDIRKLKPMMDKLDKRLAENSSVRSKQVILDGGLKSVEYYPIDHWR